MGIIKRNLEQIFQNSIFEFVVNFHARRSAIIKAHLFFIGCYERRPIEKIHFSHSVREFDEKTEKDLK